MPLPQRSGFTSVDELEWKVRRIEAVAKAMCAAEHPDIDWDREVAILDSRVKVYSLAPHYRQLADVAIATVRDFGEYA